MKKTLGLQKCLRGLRRWWWWRPVSTFTMVDGDAEALAAADADAVADGDAETLADAVADGDGEALADAVADGDTEELAYATPDGGTLAPGDAVADDDAVAARIAARDPAAVNAINPFIREGAAMAPIREFGVNMEISFLSERGPEAATTRLPKCDGRPSERLSVKIKMLPVARRYHSRAPKKSRTLGTDIQKEVIISGLAYISRCRHL